MKKLSSTSILWLLVACSTTLLVSAVVLPPDAFSEVGTAGTNANARREFVGWTQPDVVLAITGQQHGYIEPCGCTGLDSMKGGLSRRDTFLQQLRQQRGWQVVALDAGNQVRRIGAQPADKFQATINALRMMDYQAVGLGPDDLRLTLGELLATIMAVEEQGQSDLFVSANADIYGFIRSHRIIESGGMKIGVTTVLGEEARKRVRQDDVTTQPAKDALIQAVQQIRAAKCNYCVVMALADEAECQALAKQVPGIDLIVAANGVGEPRNDLTRIAGTKTDLIQTGGKAMYVGVVGLYRNQQPAIRYQRVALDARFEDSRRILENMKQYQTVLQQRGLAGLGLQPVRHERGTQFVGSETCGQCHTQAYAKWEETPHHHATKSIAEPTERSEIPRHHDPECISCHVTGWNPQAYFPYASGYESLTKTPHLLGSGCENCHGPGQAHVQAEMGEVDASEEQLMRLRSQMRLELKDAEEKCQECHDLDNSPAFHVDGAFEEYWEQIKHPWRD